MERKILAIGEILWDLLPGGKALGGAPLNFAFWAARKGFPAAAISAIGRDPLGEEILKITGNLGVDLSALQINEFPTGTVGVTLSSDGTPAYTIHEGVAWDNIKDSPQAYELAGEALAVCWGSLAQRTEDCRAAMLRIIDATPKDCLKVFDINLRQHFYCRETIEASLRRADILKLNEEELPIVEEMLGLGSPEAVMEAYNLKYLVHTCGSEKSEIYGMATSRCGEQISGGNLLVPGAQGHPVLLSSIPTPKVEVVSTVGAGDAFTATFVADILSGQAPEQAHQDAVKVSAGVCTQAGAMF